MHFNQYPTYEIKSMYGRRHEETADYWEVRYDRKYREGIWLPTSANPEGFIQTDQWQDEYHAGSYHHDHAKILSRVAHGSPLGAVLGYVGIRAQISDRVRGTISSKVYFPNVTTLIERATKLNESLPRNHTVPEFTPHNGDYTARDFLKALANGQVLVATSESATKERDGASARAAAHDMTFHIPYWLALPPSAVKRLEDRATDALCATPEDAIETDSIVPTLKTGQVMRDIDSGISAFGMSNVLLDSYASASNKFSDVFATNSRATSPIMEEIREHVTYLSEHITAFDAAA
jgi:hypothetical protein